MSEWDSANGSVHRRSWLRHWREGFPGVAFQSTDKVSARSTNQLWRVHMLSVNMRNFSRRLTSRSARYRHLTSFHSLAYSTHSPSSFNRRPIPIGRNTACSLLPIAACAGWVGKLEKAGRRSKTCSTRSLPSETLSPASCSAPRLSDRLQLQ